MTRIPQLLLLTLLAFATTPTYAAEKHLLVLDRTQEVGDTYRMKLSAKGHEANNSTLGGQKVGSEMKRMSGTMTTVIEVLAMHEDDSIQQAVLKIESFEGMFNDKPVELDTTKRLIVTGKPDSTTYTYENGDKIEDDETIQLLNLLTNYVISNGSEGEGDDGEKPSDEEIFNLADPKAVGDSWACNNKLMAEDLATEGVVADPEKMKSEMRFVAIEDHNELKCAKLVVGVDFGPIDIPELTEQGFVIDKSSMSLAVNGLVPLDTEAVGGTFELELKMTMSTGMDIPQGKLHLNIESSHSAKIVHLPMKD